MTAANAADVMSVVCVFAHPDDEGFGFGGTLAMLARRGHRVTMICATSGDVGEISDPALATPETLAEVRRQEMRQAMSVTGIEDVRFLLYRDSGMDGTPDNRHPDSLYQAPPETVVARITAILEERQPDVVITHDPTGGYGHPDHVTVSRRATAAVSSISTDGAGPLLYYVCFPRSNFRRMWRHMTENGITPPVCQPGS